jgi:hypothetical protein
VTVGANLRFKVILRYHNNLRRGRRPRRPLFGLPQTLCVRPLHPAMWVRWVRPSTSALCASGHATICLPQQRRARCGSASPNSVGTHLHLPLAHRAKARHSAILSGLGRTDTYPCHNATRLSPKAASLVPFLPRQERNRPPRRRSAERRGAASPYLQTPQPRRTAERTKVKAKQNGEARPLQRKIPEKGKAPASLRHRNMPTPKQKQKKTPRRRQKPLCL